MNGHIDLGSATHRKFIFEKAGKWGRWTENFFCKNLISFRCVVFSQLLVALEKYKGLLTTQTTRFKISIFSPRNQTDKRKKRTDIVFATQVPSSIVSWSVDSPKHSYSEISETPSQQHRQIIPHSIPHIHWIIKRAVWVRDLMSFYQFNRARWNEEIDFKPTEDFKADGMLLKVTGKLRRLNTQIAASGAHSND